MLIHRPWNIDLLALAQDVIERDRDKPRRRLRQETSNRGKLVARTVSSVRGQYLTQTLLRPGALGIALAWFKPDAALGAQIMCLEPAAQARQIVRVERGKRLGGIPLRRAEAAIILALEQYHQISPEPPARQRVAKTLRYRA